LNADQLRRRAEQLRECIRNLDMFDPNAVRKRYSIPEVMQLEAEIDEALAAAFGADTPSYQRYSGAKRLDNGPHAMRMGPMFGGGSEAAYDAQDAIEARQYLAEGKMQALALLRQAVQAIENRIADLEPAVSAPVSAQAIHSSENRKVFVVHGREEGPREAIARFLGDLGFRPIILHEQANQGQTVIEKVESHSDVGFAVVLLTPDDMGNLKGELPQPRARQNVLLELGYFIGKLKRNRVCTFKVGELEIPSDWRGVVDEPYDMGGGWKQTLARELQAAGYEVDWNTVMRR
jgi:predicted nucleotide-binding protein